MVQIWVTSDTHFGHENIIKYCNRPFRDAREMNEALIENWNRVVKPSDHVYHLGDVYLPSGFEPHGIETLLKRLNGKKRLIVGNHDNLKDPVLHRFFEKIMLWRHWKDHRLLLTHIPINTLSIIKECTNAHGHIHEKKSPEGPYRNVCVEQTNYTPVNIESLRN